MTLPKILSPMASGNGAYIVHKMIEAQIPGYKVRSYNPWWQLCPFFIPLLGRRQSAGLIHTTPDYGYLSRRKNTPLVVTFHGFVLDKETQRYSTFLQRIHHETGLRYFTRKALNVADRVTAVSNFTADLVRAEFGYEKEIKVIYNGIDLDGFRPDKKKRSGPIRVLFSGNLTRRKGANLIPKIADLLNENIIIQYTAGLRAKSLGVVSDRLLDLGHIPYGKMPEIYRQSDMLLFPTVREGFGLAALEAMATGLPVVATNCSSLPELVVDGRGGFLCELGNIREFAARINQLADSGTLRREMGDFNRSRAIDKFSIGRMIAEYRSLFSEL